MRIFGRRQRGRSETVAIEIKRRTQVASKASRNKPVRNKRRSGKQTVQVRSQRNERAISRKDLLHMHAERPTGCREIRTVGKRTQTKGRNRNRVSVASRPLTKTPALPFLVLKHRKFFRVALASIGKGMMRSVMLKYWMKSPLTRQQDIAAFRKT